MKKVFICLLIIFMTMLSTNLVLSSNLPNKQGVYYLPNGLTDVRDIKFKNSEIIITSKSELGDVFIAIYNMGKSHLSGSMYFKAVDNEKVLENDLPDANGKYYLPQTLTDVKDVKIFDDEIMITSKTKFMTGDVISLLYSFGNSNPTSIASFESTSIDKILKDDLPNEKGKYYLPNGLSDLRDLEIKNSEVFLTSKALSGKIMTIIYEMGKSIPKNMAVFEPKPINKIVDKDFKREQGVYYLPESFTDVKDLAIKGPEICLTSRGESGDIIATIYEMGESYPNSILIFKLVSYEEFAKETLKKEQGLYYLPKALNDFRGIEIIGEEVLLTARNDSGNIFTMIYEAGNSYPVSIAHFKPTEPEKCFK
ncbi:hypothetical protein Halha_0417 [Halobacteroides halobius DSM 5150]|uniref:Uncharacterized protein n=1 Tax=Halobacteroides halobius (strain ATCC 35273 / DSM 5150 / MD-1) TaxID=748449 RepID=L0K572_HALHC|nr:hypothetical protein [Halobacteroides halobius]AGB40412.1 hypothetical protein Halha_0417 [Halobacteroides halobius DSM 5150]